MTFQNVAMLGGGLLLAVLIIVFVASHLFHSQIYIFSQDVETPEQRRLKDVEVLDFTSEDGAKVQAWVRLPEGDAPVIFYFMGNFTSIGPSVERLKPFLDQGLGVAALVYRGSSGADGAPSEAAFAADARALYDQFDQLTGTVTLPEQRIAFGYSLGTGVATRLASERAFSGLVLEAAYARFCDYFTDKYYRIPFCALMWKERYDSADRIDKIRAPLLMLHGEKDAAIKIMSGKNLFAVASEPKQFITYENGSHVDLNDHGLNDDVTRFIEEVAPGVWSNRQ